MTATRKAIAVAAIVALNLVISSVPVDAFSLSQQVNSFEEERRNAASQHADVVAQFGGEYDDPELAAYVDRVGQRMVASSQLSGLAFRFTVLNSPILNAFTTGGGHIYVTRGMLALMNTEAELAALLGHEIAHVTERHSARREASMKQDRAATVGIGLLSGRLTAALLTDMLGTVDRSPYSRQQEEDADIVGQQTLAKAGYDPYGMPDMLEGLAREAAMAERLYGGGGLLVPAWLQDHPQTSDRIKYTIEQAQRANAQRGSGEIGRETHLEAIDGMLHGADPANGVFRDGRFLHPGLGFAFDIPNGYQIVNALGLVIGFSDARDFFVFSGAEWPETRSLEEFALSAWSSVTDDGAGDLDSVDQTDLNGFEAILATKRFRKFGLTATLASVVFRTAPDTVYGFSFVVTGDLTDDLISDFRGIAESFTPLTPEAAEAIRPYRVRVVTAGSMDTAETIAANSVFTDLAVERFRSFNGLSGGVEQGDRFKLIVEE